MKLSEIVWHVGPQEVEPATVYLTDNGLSVGDLTVVAGADGMYNVIDQFGRCIGIGVTEELALVEAYSNVTCVVENSGVNEQSVEVNILRSE